MIINTISSLPAKPTAFITKDKQRLKQFGSNVYLKNGEEFEIEVFNPTSTTVLAKIKINGEFISDTGLVIRPGERVFLERYFDIPKKFMFSTYTVDANNSEVEKAIQLNGDVEILFFNEKEILPKPIYCNYSDRPRSKKLSKFDNFTYSTYGILGMMDSGLDFSADFKDTKETGRIEEGNNSNQNFTKVNKEFNPYTSARSTWKILPESEKPKQINELPVYCTKCGTKKKKYKFCPNCGTKFENSETKLVFIDDVYYEFEDKVYMLETYNLPLNKVIENNPHKLIVVHRPSLSENQTRAIIIEY